jgi:hypothetical protein
MLFPCHVSPRFTAENMHLGQQQRDVIDPLRQNRQWLIHLISVSESLHCIQIYANRESDGGNCIIILWTSYLIRSVERRPPNCGSKPNASRLAGVMTIS